MDVADLSSELTVEEVMDQWPETAVVFRKYADACVGCNLAAFCSIEEAANEYEVRLSTFMNALRVCIKEAL